jgi:antirestriction protein ArdC
MESSTMANTDIKWSEILNEAITVPGRISDCYSTFYNYSIGNQLLAYSQLQQRKLPIGPIATYKKWKELNRQVQKGQKAIALCMPVSFEKKDSAGNKTGEFVNTFMFKNNWFALSQTEGQDYEPEQVTPNWNSKKALETLNVERVDFELANGNVQGYATRDNKIAINPVAKEPEKTLFHELAHIVLGHTSEHTMSDSESTPKNIKEVEAESVAYILCSVLGLGDLSDSRAYIQDWLNHEQVTDKSAQKIFAAADKILKAGE